MFLQVELIYQKDKLKDSGWRLNKHWIEDVDSGREAEHQNRVLEEFAAVTTIR